MSHGDTDQQPVRLALDELRSVAGRTDDAAVDRACEMIARGRKTVVFGCGREGLQIRGFAVRLFHLGRDVAGRARANSRRE